MLKSALRYLLCLALTVLTSGSTEWEAITTPTLFRDNNDARRWKIIQRDREWKLEHFSPVLGKLHNVYTSESPVFTYYDTEAVKSRFPSFRPEYELVSTTARRIFKTQGIRDKPIVDSKFYYISSNMMNKEFIGMKRAMDPTTLIGDRDVTALFWGGTEGVLATAHYDAVYNVYTQLAGTKKIKLIPPGKADLLFVHGRFHPHACQSRIRNVTEGNVWHSDFRIDDALHLNNVANHPCSQPSSTSIMQTGVSPESSNVLNDVIEFTLEAGDVLFIPPFWIHETEAVTASASVSFWWDAPQLQVMDDVYALPLPFEDSWNAEMMHAAAANFAVALVNAISADVHLAIKEQKKDASETCRSRTDENEDVGLKCDPVSDASLVAQASFVLTLLRNRYMEDLQAWLHVKGSDPSEGEPIPVKSVGAIAMSSDCFSLEVFGADRDSVHEKISARVIEYSKLFIKMMYLHENDSSNQAAIMWLKVADYIEDVFEFAAGGAQSHPSVILFPWLYGLVAA
jgi:hypothetical protein